MGAQEEWLNGLEAEGLAHKLDVMRIERFERLNIIVQETTSDDASEIGYGKESQLKQRQPDFSQQTHGDRSQQQVYAQGPHQRHRKISIVSASNLSASPQSIDSRPKFVQGHSIDGPKNGMLDIFLSYPRPTLSTFPYQCLRYTPFPVSTWSSPMQRKCKQLIR